MGPPVKPEDDSSGDEDDGSGYEDDGSGYEDDSSGAGGWQFFGWELEKWGEENRWCHIIPLPPMIPLLPLILD